MLAGDPVPEHLFVSYATEDRALAEWLTRKLTAQGYRVWCDRFKLLGGESYPRDIDLAIKTRTFRVLALLSRASISKPNPMKERTLALNIGRARTTDFLIPLNVDGLRATELDWMTSDLTFIPFAPGWAPGLRQLLEKLASIETPRPLDNGRQIAASTFLPGDILSHAPESVFSNCFTVTIPKTLLRWHVSPGIPYEERDSFVGVWPFYFVSPDVVLSFDTPSGAETEGRTITLDNSFAVESTVSAGGIPTRNIVTHLINRSVTSKALSLGLRSMPNGRGVYFPHGLIENDRLRFVGYNGRETFVHVTGEKTLWRPGKSEKYRHYLAVENRVRRDVAPGYVVLLTPTIYVTNSVGKPLPGRSVNSRRKHVSKSWTNHQWTNRLLAIAEFLSGQMDAVRIGSNPEREVTISAHPTMMSAPVGINEAALDREPPDDDGTADRDDGDEFDDDDE